jgi:hypothetical protein
VGTSLADCIGNTCIGSNNITIIYLLVHHHHVSTSQLTREKRFSLKLSGTPPLGLHHDKYDVFVQTNFRDATATFLATKAPYTLLLPFFIYM